MIDPACSEEQPTQIDIQRIMEMIPHRHPFLMIDKVVDVVANERATGIKNLSINENYFQGHFPARPGDAGRADHRGDGANRRGPGCAHFGSEPPKASSSIS